MIVNVHLPIMHDFQCAIKSPRPIMLSVRAVQYSSDLCRRAQQILSLDFGRYVNERVLLYVCIYYIYIYIYNYIYIYIYIYIIIYIYIYIYNIYAYIYNVGKISKYGTKNTFRFYIKIHNFV